MTYHTKSRFTKPPIYKTVNGVDYKVANGLLYRGDLDEYLEEEEAWERVRPFKRALEIRREIAPSRFAPVTFDVPRKFIRLPWEDGPPCIYAWVPQ